jgi:hypothetical protein
MSKLTALKPKLKVSATGITFRFTYQELAAFTKEVEKGYNKAKREGVPGYGDGTLLKQPIEGILIDLCFEALVKLEKKKAERWSECSITLSMNHARALWEFWECGLITFDNNLWAKNLIRSTFTDMHPLLTA